MTLLGKVFMFVTLLLSGIFFALALAINASHTNWRDAATGPKGFQAQIKESKQTITELKAAIEKAQNELGTEQAARRVALAALQTQLAEEKEQTSTKEAQLLALNGTNTLLNQTLAQTQQDNNRLATENDQIKKQVDQTIQDRNTQRLKVVSLTDQLNSLQSVMTDLRTQEEQLRNQNTLLEARTQTMRATLVSAGLNEDPDDAPPAGLKGEVLAVGRDNMIEVSVGRDDGIKSDHLLEVYRGSQYLGRLRILRVEDDKAIGAVLPGFRKGRIQAGDQVAANIGG